MIISRRKLLAAAASITLVPSLSLKSLGTAEAASHDTRTRHNATSLEGKEMLKLYARGVANMRSQAMAGSPSDWTYQWYVHAIRTDQNKQQALNIMYPNTTDTRRELADLTWSTCQAHMPGTIPDDFLPWHRAYVYVFELIMRDACGDDSFTLPYWDYTTDSRIPQQFRSPDDPTHAALFIPNRNGGPNGGVNAGVPISNSLTLDVMKQRNYRAATGNVPPGFNRNLDRTLHGNVHGDTGDGMNMGSVPWAARDPIFWLHHCNIDRIWAGWNAAGTGNPNPAAFETNNINPTDSAWRNRSHTFADKDGNRRLFKNEEVTSTDLLKYRYDVLPAPPPPVFLAAGHGEDPDREPVPVAQSSSAVTFAGGAVSLTLVRPVIANGTELTVLPEAGRKRYLVLSDVTANVMPGSNYEVHANRPGEEGEGYFLGTINFFGAEMQPLEFVLDVTEQLAGETNVDPLQFTLIPTRDVNPENNASIGSVTLVEK